METRDRLYDQHFILLYEKLILPITCIYTYTIVLLYNVRKIIALSCLNVFWVHVLILSGVLEVAVFINLSNSIKPNISH